MYKKSWIFLGALILIIASATLFYSTENKSQIEGKVVLTEEITPNIRPAPKPEPPITKTPEPKSSGITTEELTKHNTENNCWISYNNKVYDFSEAKMHPNMAKTFFRHCGQISGFREGATSRHGSKSSEDRVKNYGNYIGNLT